MLASFAVLAFLVSTGDGIRMQMKLDGSRESSHVETNLLEGATNETQEKLVSLVGSETDSTLLTEIRSPWKALVMLIAAAAAMSSNRAVAGGGREVIPSADAPEKVVVDLWSSGPLDSSIVGGDHDVARGGFFGRKVPKDADWEMIEAANKENQKKEVEADWRRDVEARLDDGLKSLARMSKKAVKMIQEKTKEMVELVVGAGLHQILKNVGDGMHKAAVKGEKIETPALTLQLDQLRPGHVAAHDIRVRLNHDVYQLEVHGLEIDINLGISELKALGRKFVKKHFGEGALENMDEVNILAQVRGGVDIGFYHDKDGTWQPEVHLDGEHRPPNLKVEVTSIEFRGRSYNFIKRRANELLNMADKPLKGLVQNLIENALRDLTYTEKWFGQLVMKALNLQYSVVEKLGFGHHLLVDHEGEDCLDKGINFCGGGMCHKEGKRHVCVAPWNEKLSPNATIEDLLGWE